MKLTQILEGCGITAVKGDARVDITGITCDSRSVAPGSLFIAVKGAAADGHRFIGSAVEKGAAAILCQEEPENVPEGVTLAVASDSRKALAFAADNFYGHPSRKLELVGITGTNGKTTTATLLYEMARLMGHKAGLLSTVENIIDTVREPAKQTTPDHLTLNRLLHEMVQAGCEYAFMEVSSHACVQRRIEGITFAGGIFTNLTRDHMDFHKTVDNYIAAKKMFFDSLPKGAFALVNVDDKVGEVMLQNTAAGKYRYSLRSIADFKGRIVESRLDGTTLELNGNQVEVLFTGRFNAYNLLSVYGASLLLGFDPQETLVKMSLLEPVAGRFQTLRSPRGYTAIVDYAHTPDALVNVLDTIREVVGTNGHVITVCGCGGDRDAGKRPIMAREAAVRSDRVVLTSDNPRTEDPDEILRQMEVGLPDDKRPVTLIITDRRQAIRTACQLAQAGDVVLIAGKGHEDYQEINHVKHHFDDREEVLEVFGGESK